MPDDDDPVQPSAEAVAAASSAPVAFAKRRNRGNIRKRPDPDAEATGDPDSALVQKAKQQRGGPLAFTTKKDDQEAVPLRYESNKALPAQVDDTATRALETETAYDRDARALREQKLQQADEAMQGDGKYHGINSYVDFRAGFKREKTIASEKGSGAHGPLRGNAFVRMTARFDYQPDICKDYKETGFCSYGDSCKFLHDRGDYKGGWEMEREWDAEQKVKMEKRMQAMLKGWNPDDGDEPPEEEEEEEDELPFACYLCRRPWAECPSEPVVTRCRHYFCQTCALKHNSKTGRCAACETATQGIFNIATDVQKRMNAEKKRAS